MGMGLRGAQKSLYKWGVNLILDSKFGRSSQNPLEQSNLVMQDGSAMLVLMISVTVEYKLLLIHRWEYDRDLMDFPLGIDGRI